MMVKVALSTRGFTRPNVSVTDDVLSNTTFVLLAKSIFSKPLPLIWLVAKPFSGLLGSFSTVTTSPGCESLIVSVVAVVVSMIGREIAVSDRRAVECHRSRSVGRWRDRFRS